MKRSYVSNVLDIADEKPANQECEGCEADLLGEGKESGEINSAQSLVFTALQVICQNQNFFLDECSFSGPFFANYRDAGL